MNALAAADRASEWRKLTALVPDSVSSPITRRVYNLGLDELIAWFTEAPRPAGFTKATVMVWRVALEARGLRMLHVQGHGLFEIADQLHCQGFSHDPASNPENHLYTPARTMERTLIESELRDATIENKPVHAPGSLPSHPAQDLDAPPARRRTGIGCHHLQGTGHQPHPCARSDPPTGERRTFGSGARAWRSGDHARPGRYPGPLRNARGTGGTGLSLIH